MMENNSRSLHQLTLISQRIASLTESTISMPLLRLAIGEAHHLAQWLVEANSQSDDYYANLLVYQLFSGEKACCLYETYESADKKTRVFNRCQRFAVKDIAAFVIHLSSS